MTLLSLWTIVSTKSLPVLFAVVGFCMLILVHELGHFLFCKIFNIHTPTFSIGFGPTIISKKIGNTQFQIAAIPLGGFVEIAGMHEIGQGEQKHSNAKDETSFNSKPYWQKALVLIGGISFNMVFAYLAFITLFFFGMPKMQVQIKSVIENSAAQQAGLQSGDRILTIGKSDISKQPELIINEIQKIQKLSNEKIKITVSRDNKIKEFLLTVPANGKTLQTTTQEQKPKAKLGFMFNSVATGEKEYFSFSQAVRNGIKRTNNIVYQITSGLRMMISKKSLKGAGGPVMIITESIKQAEAGFIYLLAFLAIISINLAIINLLPLPILDGGQLLFITIESIVGREIPFKIKNIIHIASMLFMLWLFLYLTFTDIRFFRGS